MNFDSKFSEVRRLTINAQPETPFCFALAISVSSNILDTKRVSSKNKTPSFFFFERFNCNLMFSMQTSFAITSSPVEPSRIINEFEETLTEIKIHCIPASVIAINWLH